MLKYDEKDIEPTSTSPSKSGRSSVSMNDGAQIATASTLPPPYGGNLVSFVGGPGPGRAVNLFYINERFNAISGEWMVDPNLNVPQSLLPAQIKRGEKLDNLNLYARAGGVHAAITLSSITP